MSLTVKLDVNKKYSLNDLVKNAKSILFESLEFENDLPANFYISIVTSNANGITTNTPLRTYIDVLKNEPQIGNIYLHNEINPLHIIQQNNFITIQPLQNTPHTDNSCILTYSTIH